MKEVSEIYRNVLIARYGRQNAEDLLALAARLVDRGLFLTVSNAVAGIQQNMRQRGIPDPVHKGSYAERVRR